MRLWVVVWCRLALQASQRADKARSLPRKEINPHETQLPPKRRLRPSSTRCGHSKDVREESVTRGLPAKQSAGKTRSN